MNEYIADILAQHFINLDFISKTGGCVQLLKKPQKEGKHINIPVVRRTYTSEVAGVVVCNETADLYDVAPNSNQLGIIHFEDLGADNTGHTRNYTTWKGSLKLVCWLNMKRIGSNNTVAKIVLATLSNIPHVIAQDGQFLGGTLKAAKQYPKIPHPFKNYGYNETQTQYVTHPYDYFSIKLDYITRTVKGWTCRPEVEIKPENC